MTATYLLICPLLVAMHAGEWPDSYTELDALLSAKSAKYKFMADYVQARHTYRIVSGTDFPLGNVKHEDGGLVIELNPNVPKNRRATILIWEMANAYQREKFDEIHRRAVAGEIDSHREYGLRMELVEHGSHQLHLDVLQDLSRAGYEITEDFLYFLNPDLRTLQEYRVPPVHDYIEAQAKSGHTRHYEDWYYRIPGKRRPSDR